MSSYEWYKQGLKCSTQEEFEVKLDISDNFLKIVFPIYDEHWGLCSIKTRVLSEQEKLYKDKKYFYLYPYNRQTNLYNINRAKEYIKDEIFVFEGEKSCMFAWQYGVKNCVATQGKEISPMQIRKLIDLNCNINFVFDKDVSFDFFKKYKNQLNSRLVYCILDCDNLLEDKDSPTDKGKETFLKLITQSKYKNKL
jgi:DNA primase